MFIKQYMIGNGHMAQRECSIELMADLLAARCFGADSFSETPFPDIIMWDDAQAETKIRHDVGRHVARMTDVQKVEFVAFVQSIPNAGSET